MAVDVQQITGTSRSVRQLLSGSRYGLDFYQREYSWEEAQVGELIDDLTSRFFDEHRDAHERRDVASYRPYFLGPIVTAQRDGVRYLVDGQQRITTLSLLLIYVRHRLAETHPDDAQALNSLIFSAAYGKTTFNLDVDEREICLLAVLDGEEYDASSDPKSVRNPWARYQTIVDRFSSDLQSDTLPCFSDWLQHHVILDDIGAPDQDMVLEIFETMNDCGLQLSSTDMLKSFLLARVGDESVIRDLNGRWRQRVTELIDTEKNADAEFVKAWLRGKHAVTQRERRANAAPRDFDIIGTASRKRVRDSQAAIGLDRERDYRRFVAREDLRLSSRYLELLHASHELHPSLKVVFCNARTGFTLQLPVILAAVTPEDDDETFTTKAALIAGALEIFIARRMVNYRNFVYSTVVYTMFNLIKDIRDQPPTRSEACSVAGSRPSKSASTGSVGSASRSGTGVTSITSSLASPHGSTPNSASERRWLTTSTDRACIHTRWNTSGPTNSNDTPMSSRPSTNSRITQTSSAVPCCCRRTSTPATARCPTTRMSSTTPARASWRSRCTRWHTKTTPASTLFV